MTRHARHILVAALAAILCLGAGHAQTTPAESFDALSEDIDLLRQLGEYQLAPDQLKGLAAIVQDVEAKRKALQDYKQSQETIGLMLALRDALLKGEGADAQETAVQAVWEKLQELDSAIDDAANEASKKLAALLTDDQLTVLNEGQDWAYEMADEVFANLESARAFDDATYNAWRDRTAREAGFRAAGESEEKGKQVQSRVAQFLDKVRKLKDDQFQDQSDTLFEELAGILAEAHPKPIREIAEARAAEQLEYLVRSERMPGLVAALIKARGG